MRFLGLIIVISLSLSSTAQDLNHYYGELEKTRKSVDQKVLNFLNFHQCAATYTVEEIADIYTQSNPATDFGKAGCNRNLLYSQFIESRHSSSLLSDSILEFQFKTFSHYISQLFHSLGFIAPESDFFKKPSEEYVGLMKQLIVRLSESKPIEASYPSEFYPSTPVEEAQGRLNKAKIYIFCKANYFLDYGVCHSLMKMFNLFTPVTSKGTHENYSGYLNFPEYYKFLPKLKMIKPLYDVMNEITSYVNQKGTNLKFKSIYDLLHNSFIKYGSNADQAHKLTMIILGVYGQRGSSFATAAEYITRYVPNTKESMSLKINMMNLSVIFSALSSLDKYTFNQDQTHFSLPKGFKSSFLIGKPYYFWMSATMAHEYKSQYFSFNKYDVIKSVQLLNQIYQIKAIFNERHPGHFNNKYDNLAKKQDLVVSLLGAGWALDKTSLDMDKVFYPYMLNSPDIAGDIDFDRSKGITPDILFKRSRRWNKVFKPSYLLEEIEKHVENTK